MSKTTDIDFVEQNRRNIFHSDNCPHKGGRHTSANLKICCDDCGKELSILPTGGKTERMKMLEAALEACSIEEIAEATVKVKLSREVADLRNKLCTF